MKYARRSVSDADIRRYQAFFSPMPYNREASARILV
jgi:hypothetical protein